MTETEFITHTAMGPEIEDAVERGIDGRSGKWEYSMREDTVTGKWELEIRGPQVNNCHLEFAGPLQQKPSYISKEVERSLWKREQERKGLVLEEDKLR